MKNVYLLLADGFEEIEAISPADILLRAGARVTTVSIYSDRKTVVGGHGFSVICDTVIDALTIDNTCDCVILPGGSVGVENLKASRKARELVERSFEAGAYIAAVCAAPTMLSDMGLLKGRAATCYPSLQKTLECKAVPVNEVVVDGKIITSRGAGTSGEFGFVICERLFDLKLSEKLRSGMCYREKSPTYTA